jgi:hypothetical protein
LVKKEESGGLTMLKKSFVLSKKDPVVEQFKAGLEAWERSYKAPGVMLTRAAVKTGGAVRTRGAVPTRGGAKGPSFALPKGDPGVQAFQNGLEDWERPHKRKE